MRINSFFNSATSGIEKLIDRLLCAFGALLFSQAPEFMQQYLQRLGGRLDEAHRHFEDVRSVALQAGITVDLHAQTLDSGSQGLANLLRLSSERVEYLKIAELSLRNASVITRPFVFFRYLDLDTARGVLNVYKPAIPTTFEGLTYALVGMIFMLILYYFTVRPALVNFYTRWRLSKEPPLL
jgi:hypothetical protein